MVNLVAHRHRTAVSKAGPRSRWEQLSPALEFSRKAAQLAADPKTRERQPDEVFLEVMSWGEYQRPDLIPLAFELAHTQSRGPFEFFDYQHLAKKVRYNLQEPSLPYILETYAAFPEGRTASELAEEWESWVPSEGRDALYSNLVDHAMMGADFEARRKMLADIDRDMSYDGVDEEKRFKVGRRMLDELLKLEPGPATVTSVARQAGQMLALPGGLEDLERVWNFLEANPGTAAQARRGRKWEQLMAGRPEAARRSLLEKVLLQPPDFDHVRMLERLPSDDPAWRHLQPIFEEELVQAKDKRDVSTLAKSYLDYLGSDVYSQVRTALNDRPEFQATLKTLARLEKVVKSGDSRTVLLKNLLVSPEGYLGWIPLALERIHGVDQLNLARTQLTNEADVPRILRFCELSNAKTLAGEFWETLAGGGQSPFYRDTHQQLASTFDKADTPQQLVTSLQSAQAELAKIRENEERVWLLAGGSPGGAIDIAVEEDSVQIGGQVLTRHN